LVGWTFGGGGYQGGQIAIAERQHRPDVRPRQQVRLGDR
jgi:hypothetical protein